MIKRRRKEQKKPGRRNREMVNKANCRSMGARRRNTRTSTLAAI